MANNYTTLNPGVGGDDMDEESATYAAPPLTRKKPRVVIAGNAAEGADTVYPLNSSPTGSEYALPTRNMPATPTTAGLTGAVISAAGAGDNTLVAGAGIQTVRVFRLFLVAAQAVDIIFKDGAGINLTGVMSITAGGSITLDFDSEPWFVTSAGNGFLLNLSSAVQVSGRIYYKQS